jgi:4-amino-4-deoxy-L-arabinose transferase-like glycosyltransferase
MSPETLCLRRLGSHETQKEAETRDMPAYETIVVSYPVGMPERRPLGFCKADGLAIALLSLLFVIFFSIRPVGFFGAGYDDARYAQAALNWLHAFPYLGNVHWDLRHPFNLLIAGAFHLFGVSQEVLAATCYVTDFLLVIASYLCIRIALGREVAFLSSLFWLSVPSFAVGGVSVEPLELFFCILSFWAFFAAGRTGQRRWLLISGLCLGLGWEVRETAAFLILLYALSFLFFPIIPRKDYLLLALAAGLPVGLELGWYYVSTGDFFYRFHIDSDHIHVSSAHMVGKVSHEAQALFNLKVQRSWLPKNDYLPGSWLTYPYEALFFDPFIGGAPLVSLVGLFMWLRSDQKRMRSALALLAVGAALSFVVSVYILSLRPDGRYFWFTIYAASVFAAFAICRLWQSRHRAVAGLFCCAILGVALFGLQLVNVNTGAYAAVAYLRSHSGPVLVTDEDRRMLDIDVRDPALASKLTASAATTRLHIREYPASCPKSAILCAQPSPTLLSQGLRSVGLDRHISHHLFERLSGGGTVAFITPAQR